jgi:hypothetical protein
MPTTFDFGFRDALSHFHGGARLHVLVALMLRANVRNRCWPSMRRIAKDTGYALAAVNDAKKWLEEHGAIEVVKYDQRIGDEKTEINHLQNVYQLTGVITVDGVTYPYLYVPQIETSRTETSRIETEVVKEKKLVKKERTTLAASDEDRASATSPVVESSSVKAEGGTKDVTDSLPLQSSAKGSPSRVRSAKQQANDALVEALRQAWFKGRNLPVQELGPKQISTYAACAHDLIKEHLPPEKFQAYIEYWHKASVAGGWTLTLHSLVNGGRVGDFLAFQAQPASAATPSVRYHQSYVAPTSAASLTADEQAAALRETQAGLEAIRAKKAKSL